MKTVVLYAFHLWDENVDFFCRHALFPNPHVDFIMICNGDLTPKVALPAYVQYLTRENIGYDFGAWSHAIYTEHLWDRYDYFILLNSTVRGPFIPPWITVPDWTIIFTQYLTDQVKLVGTTLGIYQGLTHLQTMLIATDAIGLKIGMDHGIFEEHPLPRTKDDIILQKEIRYSQLIFQHQYQIRPILGAYFNSSIPPKVEYNQNVLDHNGSYRYFGGNITPYEVVFIKANRQIHQNLEIQALTKIHNQNCDLISECQNLHCPLDFDYTTYLKLNPDLQTYLPDEYRAKLHWVKYGSHEQRKYK